MIARAALKYASKFTDLFGSSHKGVFAINSDESGSATQPDDKVPKSNSSGPDEVLSEECRMARVAEGILRQRRRRKDYFGTSLFAESGWDLLLELYVGESSGSSTTAEQLLTSTMGPPSIAARWLEHLQEEGLVRRLMHRGKSGTEFVELTNKSRLAMEAYLAAVREP